MGKKNLNFKEEKELLVVALIAVFGIEGGKKEGGS